MKISIYLLIYFIGHILHEGVLKTGANTSNYFISKVLLLCTMPPTQCFSVTRKISNKYRCVFSG